MIKKQKIVAGGTVNVPTQAVLAQALDSDYQRLSKLNENYIEEHKRILASLRNLERDTLSMQARRDANLTEQTRIQVKLEAHDTTIAQKKAVELLKQLKGMTQLEAFTLQGNALEFTTKPLFTNIRVSDGSKVAKRRCIGAFTVRTGLTDSYIYATNRTFRTLYRPHWSIRDGNDFMQCCLGDWETTFRELKNQRDIIGLITTMITYLKSTDDSGAYCKSHTWIEDMRNIELKTCKKVFQVGDHIVLTQYDNMDSGTRGVIREIHPEGKHFRLKECKEVDGTAFNYQPTSWIQIDSLEKISALEYKRAVMVKSIDYIKLSSQVKPAQVATLIKKIDSLPQGTTNATLLELISKK